MGDFVLRGELHGHTQDVRAICAVGDSAVATASRDRTAKIWSVGSDGTYKTTATLVGHSNFVSAIAFGGSAAGDLSIATGSNDRSVRLWDLSAAGPLGGVTDAEVGDLAASRTLTGHTQPVCSVSFLGSGSGVLSSSWDGTARVFSGTGTSAELVVCPRLPGGATALPGAEFDAKYPGGEGLDPGSRERPISLLSCLAPGSGGVPPPGAQDGADPAADCIVIGCADARVLLFSRSGAAFAAPEPAPSSMRHGDAVRCVCRVPGYGIASSSNDATVKVWKTASSGGAFASVLEGHEAFVYSVAYGAGTCEFATASEDGTARVWDAASGRCVAVLRHPTTVWAVAFLGNGDVATACADGVARVFTRDPSRAAPAEAVAAYQAALDAAEAEKLAKKREKLSKLRDVSTLSQKFGSRAGENIIVRNGDIAEAYQWDGNRWQLMGEVVDPPVDSGPGLGKKSIAGKEYDFVFDVDLGDGSMRQLGYNLADNPYAAAQEFIWAENLQQENLDQIAKFIYDNVPTLKEGGGGSGGGGISGGGGGGGATGVTPMDTSSSLGGAATTTAPASTPTGGAAAEQLFPVTAPYAFDRANFAPVVAKLRDFNADAGAAALSAQDLSGIDGLVQVLSAKGTAGKTLTADHVAALDKALALPAAKRFPALDILRSAVMHGSAPGLYSGSGIVARLSAMVTDPSCPPPAALMALRAIANLATSDAFHRELIAESTAAVRAASSQCVPGTGKHNVSAAVSVLANVTMVLARCANDPAAGEAAKEACPLALRGAAAVLGAAETEEDAATRAMMAIGTALVAGREIESVIASGREIAVAKITAAAAARFRTNSTFRSGAAQIASLLNPQN